MGFLRFLSYNNAVPIAVSLMLVGGASAFAATDPQAIYSEQQTVLSEDNTYLVDKDLSTYTPKVEITGVTEDSDNYYVAYKLTTIDLQDYAWQDVTRADTMKVSKATLGPYRDLGVFVTMQFKQLISSELDRLKVTQKNERDSVSHKVVSTEYGGLVGKFLDSTTAELPGYTPVVTPPQSDNSQVASAGGSNGSGSSSSSNSNSNSSNNSAGIQILGNNPAQIPLHSSYVDLGAVVTDSRGTGSLDIDTFLDGKPVDNISLDTSTTSTHVIRYVYAPVGGQSLSAERTVIVYDPAIGPPVPESQVQVSQPVQNVIQAVPAPVQSSPAPEATSPLPPTPSSSEPTTSTNIDPATNASTSRADQSTGTDSSSSDATSSASGATTGTDSSASSTSP